MSKKTAKIWSFWKSISRLCWLFLSACNKQVFGEHSFGMQYFWGCIVQKLAKCDEDIFPFVCTNGRPTYRAFVELCITSFWIIGFQINKFGFTREPKFFISQWEQSTLIWRLKFWLSRWEQITLYWDLNLNIFLSQYSNSPSMKTEIWQSQWEQSTLTWDPILKIF